MVHFDKTYRLRIREVVEPAIEAEGMELVDIECSKSKSRWFVRIYIDKESGITVDDCAVVSDHVGDLLDIYDIFPGAYTLEVSSPGLDRPLARDKDFMKYRGCVVKIKTTLPIDGRRNFLGTLVDYTETANTKNIVVEVEGTEYTIPISIIAKANLQYEF